MKEFILGALLGVALSIFFFGANYLMHGYVI
jgi:type III secretory pathway component EscT